MIIQKKRINNVEKYLASIKMDESIYVCVNKNDVVRKYLKDNGFENEDAFYPVEVGPSSYYNLHERIIARKDLPKEPRTIEHDFHIVDWHGDDHYGTCFQTRECYQRDIVMPPCIYMINDDEMIRSEKLHKQDGEIVKHTINLFLETFGVCEIVGEDFVPVSKRKIKILEWEILPPGKYPWDKVKQDLNAYFEKLPDNNKLTISNRHRIITSYVPDFVAIGRASFAGYIVYGYLEKNLYFFESNEPNNATYIFEGEWENASKLTKKDILLGDLCYKRLIHNEKWEKEICQILN